MRKIPRRYTRALRHKFSAYALPLALLGLLAGPATGPVFAQGHGEGGNGGSGGISGNGSKIAYSSIPQQVPGNVSSLGFEATSTSEFGDEVGLAALTQPASATPEPRTLKSLQVVMSSQKCQNGSPSGGDCLTTPGATFTHPITANIYAVDNSGPVPAPGALLATVTKTFNIPYRPSADPVNCTGSNAGKWFSPADNTCYNGLAHTVKFDFPGVTTLPDQVIWTVAYNTTHAGYNPIGESAPCFTSGNGCPYDSLNVGAQTFPGAPFAGTDVDPNGVFINSSSASTYCDGGAGGTGTLRLDTPCWTGFTPLGEIKTKG
ncbi:hypothetical protein [Streptomyces sp. MK37H]|uniref:hypothetical protein n=1 Tax=Streptomyces sp. MK37H TaxID=2699117 RepID=UPI001B393801|nr:hypothetical protein [Streptomyces sp. MK37H]MBP8539183.1 hypothetical protein [Streptomyces sp. MK37H]